MILRLMHHSDENHEKPWIEEIRVIRIFTRMMQGSELLYFETPSDEEGHGTEIMTSYLMGWDAISPVQSGTRTLKL